MDLSLKIISIQLILLQALMEKQIPLYKVHKNLEFEIREKKDLNKSLLTGLAKMKNLSYLYLILNKFETLRKLKNNCQSKIVFIAPLQM